MNDKDTTDIFDKTLSQSIRGPAESSYGDDCHNLTRLWCEVVRLAIQDIHYGRNNAIEWLHSRDFVTVCQLANLPNPERLRRAILKLPKGRRLNSLAA